MGNAQGGLNAGGWQAHDIDWEEGDPFAVALATAERETLSMVRRALSMRNMYLALQPVVYAADPALIGYYKAYIRLRDDQGRSILAGDFMALAERQLLGREIDLAALELALSLLEREPKVRVAITMSARSLGYAPWTKLLREKLRFHPALGQNLILEISQSSAMAMPDVLLPFIEEFRPAGLRFSLDDFGVGALSLPRLEELGFDLAKLDGRFVHGLTTSPPQQRILRAAIALAQQFNMFLIAEAVETNEEALWLRQHGVGCLQGYLFGKPQRNPDFTAFRQGRETVTPA